MCVGRHELADSDLCQCRRALLSMHTALCTCMSAAAVIVPAAMETLRGRLRPALAAWPRPASNGTSRPSPSSETPAAATLAHSSRTAPAPAQQTAWMLLLWRQHQQQQLLQKRLQALKTAAALAAQGRPSTTTGLLLLLTHLPGKSRMQQPRLAPPTLSPRLRLLRPWRRPLPRLLLPPAVSAQPMACVVSSLLQLAAAAAAATVAALVCVTSRSAQHSPQH